MKIEILPEAKQDLDDGYWFYENLRNGLGEYFLSSVTSDIRSLQIFPGHHVRIGKYYRLIAGRFPYSVFYTFEDEIIFVHAVIDQRRDPEWISERLN